MIAKSSPFQTACINVLNRKINALEKENKKLKSHTIDKPLIQKMAEFHEKFNLEYKGPIRQLPEDIQNYRNNCLLEELNEYYTAVDDRDLAEQFDALIDLVYFAIGTAYLNGFHFDKGFDIVHKANMSKQRAKNAKDSKRNSVFDTIKPFGWQSPDLNPLLKKNYIYE